MITQQQSEAARDKGMDLADAKATKDNPRWKADAMAALNLYCTAHQGQKFLTEDFRDWCVKFDLADMPENMKAFGPLMRQAAKDGIIKNVGYMPARSSNQSAKTAWLAA